MLPHFSRKPDKTTMISHIGLAMHPCGCLPPPQTGSFEVQRRRLVSPGLGTSWVWLRFLRRGTTQKERLRSWVPNSLGHPAKWAGHRVDEDSWHSSHEWEFLNMALLVGSSGQTHFGKHSDMCEYPPFPRGKAVCTLYLGGSQPSGSEAF